MSTIWRRGKALRELAPSLSRLCRSQTIARSLNTIRRKRGSNIDFAGTCIRKTKVLGPNLLILTARLICFISMPSIPAARFQKRNSLPVSTSMTARLIWFVKIRRRKGSHSDPQLFGVIPISMRNVAEPKNKFRKYMESPGNGEADAGIV